MIKRGVDRRLMERGDGDAVLAAHIGGAKVILLPRQDPHDLLFVEPKPRRPNVLPNFTDSSKISRRFRGSDQIGPNSPDLRPGSTSFSFRDGSRCLTRPAASSSTNSASNIGLSSPVCRRGGPGSPNRLAISTRSARTRSARAVHHLLLSRVHPETTHRPCVR